MIRSGDVPPRGGARIGTWELRWLSEPHGGAELGGDRFALIDRDGDLWFLLADATGHGRAGEPLWEAHGEAIHAALREATAVGLASGSPAERISGFAEQVNERLVGAPSTDEHWPHLCASVGLLTPDGFATWANFGYGTHVLALTPEGVAWNDPDRLFGIKLGWLDSKQWRQAPRAVVLNQARQVERLVLLTDGFLPDDHCDIDATLAKLQAVGESCRSLPRDEVIPHVLTECLYGHDDATVLVVERSRT